MIAFDIMSVIFDNLDFKSQIKFRQISDIMYDNLQVTDFFDIDNAIKRKLSNKILVNYPYIKRLDGAFNRKITSVK